MTLAWRSTRILKTPTDAMTYLLEEGLPIWLVKSGTNYPLEHFTYRKAELLFAL